jgi:hypothetical protein
MRVAYGRRPRVPIARVQHEKGKIMRTMMGMISVATLVAAASSNLAVAADLPKEGNYNIHSCTSGVTNEIAFSKDHRVISIEQWGSTFSNPPGGMLDKGVFHCLGLQTVFAGKNVFSHYCELVFADGDKILAHFSPGPDGTSIRDTVAGTGKYEGLLLSGKVMPLGPYPVVKAGTFQNCNHQTGTYKLK